MPNRAHRGPGGKSLALLCALVLPLVAGNCGNKDDSGSGETGETAVTPDDFWDIEAVYGIANVDDDDGNGAVDWSDGGGDAENDRAPLVIPAGVGEVSATLSGTGIRVWQDGQLLLHEDAPTASIDATAEVLLGIEFQDHLTPGTLSFSGDGGSNDVSLLSAPLLLNHHLQTATHLWIISLSSGWYTNTEMVADLEDILGDAFTGVSGNAYGQDVWIQDEIEFSWLRGPDVAGEVVVDSIRSQNGQYLDAFAENELEGPDMAVQTWGQGMANSLDSFGNLETSPPVTVDGVTYPFGRTYFGGAGGYQPSSGMQDFLESQLAQDMFMPDTTWLCVGHVDEYFTFVPDGSSEKGFKLLITDVDAAWELLDAMDPNTAIPQYQSAHGVSTVGELTRDQALRDANEDIQRDHIEPTIELLETELGLTDDDIIRVPGIFEENSWCHNLALSLIPGMINLAVYTESETTSKLLIADPFLRASGASQDSDPMIQLWDSLMPAGNETYYLNDWEVYHEGWGEVHCGTNIRREPGADWWTDAQHLLGGE